LPALGRPVRIEASFVLIRIGERGPRPGIALVLVVATPTIDTFTPAILSWSVRMPGSIMDQDEFACSEHVWASIGVTIVDGTVTRVWDCERCPAWTKEPLDPEWLVDWDESDLAR
jgi:hypothetical protein